MASRRQRYRALLRILLRNGTKAAGRYVQSLQEFAKAQQLLHVIGDSQTDSVDCFVLGSDTIWNLESRNLVANIPVFWGSKFKNARVISYAASAGNAGKELFAQHPELSEAARAWSAVSVRDRYTYDIISSLTDHPVRMVCDPTLLLPAETYREDAGGIAEGNYIFLYLFSRLSEEQMKDLRCFADENGLRIIRGTPGQDPGVDECIVNSPFTFLRYMAGARYVITDTFHGTLFSINFNRQFVALDRGKIKVNEIIRTLGLERRLVSDGDELLSRLTEKMDYEPVNKTLDEMRTASLTFLRENLSKTEEQ